MAQIFVVACDGGLILYGFLEIAYGVIHAMLFLLLKFIDFVGRNDLKVCF